MLLLGLFVDLVIEQSSLEEGCSFSSTSLGSTAEEKWMWDVEGRWGEEIGGEEAGEADIRI